MRISCSARVVSSGLGALRHVLVILSLIISTSLVFGQAVQTEEPSGETSAAQESGPGPLVVERLESGFVVTPDFKFTEIDSESTGLIGGYGGWLVDQRLLVGFGGYFHADPADDQKIGYGGVVVEWFTPKTHFVSFSIRGLIGGGTATLGNDAMVTRRSNFFDGRFRGFPFDRRGRSSASFGPGDTTVRLLEREGFFIAEPQVNVYLNFSRRFRLGLGVGYRIVAADRDFDSRLRGASATLALQIGSF